LEPT
jgi:hypothetical protein